MSQADLAEVWARSLEEFSDLQIEPHQRAWLRLTRPMGLVENTALIATPNEFVKEQLETRLRALVTHALSRELGRSIQLAVTVDPAATATLSPGPAAPLGQPDLPGESVIVPMPREADHPGRDESPAGLAPVNGPIPGTAPGNGTLQPPAAGTAAPGTGTVPPAPPGGQTGGHLGTHSGGLHHRPGDGPGLPRPAPAQARLNPKYTFETFVIGSSNRFAHAAAVAVAEAPAKA